MIFWDEKKNDWRHEAWAEMGIDINKKSHYDPDYCIQHQQYKSKCACNRVYVQQAQSKEREPFKPLGAGYKWENPSLEMECPPMEPIINGMKQFAPKPHFQQINTEDKFQLTGALDYIKARRALSESVKNHNKAMAETTETKTDAALRYNNGKLQWSLVDFDALEDMVRVLEFGANKYAANNWKKGLGTTKIIESLMRHLQAYLRGENNDPESSLSHTGHILCNAMFLAYMMKFKPEYDDRFSDDNKQRNG